MCGLVKSFRCLNILNKLHKRICSDIGPKIVASLEILSIDNILHHLRYHHLAIVANSCSNLRIQVVLNVCKAYKMDHLNCRQFVIFICNMGPM